MVPEEVAENYKQILTQLENDISAIQQGKSIM